MTDATGMPQVQRFDLSCTHCELDRSKVDDGEYVMYDDYERLADLHAAVVQERDALNSQLAEQEYAIDHERALRTEAQLQRDALAERLARAEKDAARFDWLVEATADGRFRAFADQHASRTWIDLREIVDAALAPEPSGGAA